MTRILRITGQAGALPSDDAGWARDALREGHGADAVRAFLGYDDGGALPDTALPRALRLRTRRLPDLFWTAAGLLVASTPMRVAIEAFDPDLHRFWPIGLSDAAGVSHGGHHGLIVRAAALAIREAGSLCHVEPADPRRDLPRHVTLIAHSARIDPARLPGANLWWDRALSQPYLMASEPLALAMEALDSIPMRRCRD